MCNKTLSRLISKNCTFPSFDPFIRYTISCENGMNSNIKKYSVLPPKLMYRSQNCLLTTRPTNFRREQYVYIKQKVLGSLDKSSFVDCRFYCSQKKPDLPKLMDFPQVVWPSMFKTIRNWILSNFIIMRYFDQDFNLPDFVAGSKQAVELVSGLISKGDTESLTGLVTPEVITQVQQSLNVFTLKQRQEFAIKGEDIYFCFPYEVGVMFPNEDKSGEGEAQTRFVEITMCYHALQGLQELRAQGLSPSLNTGMAPEYQDKIFICNYRFIREFTKGVSDDWTINAINHFKPAVML